MTYRDPITEFVESLYINFDFENARTKLRECEEVRYLSSNRRRALTFGLLHVFA